MFQQKNLGVKNSKWDKADGYFVPRECYNSYFYIVEDDSCNILDKFILHGNKLTKYLDGGSALHMNLDEYLTREQYTKIRRRLQLKLALNTIPTIFLIQFATIVVILARID